VRLLRTIAFRVLALIGVAAVAALSAGCSDSCSNPDPSTCPRVTLPYPVFRGGIATIDVSELYDPQTPDLYIYAGLDLPSGISPSLDGVAPAQAVVPPWGKMSLEWAVYVWSPTPTSAESLQLVENDDQPSPFVFCQFVDNACESQFPPGVQCPD
jgi:hypothetical protein